MKSRRGGAADARLMCVVEASELEQGRLYRLPTELDFKAVREATSQIDRWRREHKTGLSVVPDEEISLNEIRRINVPIYGMTHWGDLFTSRQLLALSTLSQLVREVGTRLEQNTADSQFVVAVQTCLALAVSRQVDYTTSLCSWHTTGEKINHTFGRQAIPMFWDFTEVFPLSGKTGDFGGAIEWVALVCETQGEAGLSPGQASAATATKSPLPEASANAFITDPPYYDAVPYAYLSDFFYVWLRRMLFDVQADLFRAEAVPKEDEIVVDRPHELSQSKKDIKVYEKALTEAFAEGRRVLRPDGIGTIVFASKTTASWEAILKAVVDAGWIITASWPIDTEMEAKVAAIGQARLMSSVHLVCRPRQVLSSSTSKDVGDWRDVLHALPPRMREWMPRLAKEGVVGADAIFACIGPALEIFSRYSHVEKANGQIVGLPEYLEQVWAAVAKEALSVVFKGADASGFEEDGRLTAMWLWTLFAGQSSNGDSPAEPEQDEEPQEAGDAKKGYVLEYDTARKIAQGLGAHLESLTSLVQIKGETATLLSVVERTRVLFAKDESDAPTTVRKKRTAQLKLGFIAELEEAEGAGSWGSKGAPAQGATVLDRVHQCMILFAAGRSEALRRFLVEEGVGKDERFWRLAQVLLYLYPSASDERRWIEGVLARKKGLGF